MIVRYKSKHDRIVWLTRLDTESMTHILTDDPETIHVITNDGDTMNPKYLEVRLGDTWKCMAQAFKDRDIVPDSCETSFDVPTSQANKDRGYND